MGRLQAVTVKEGPSCPPSRTPDGKLVPLPTRQLAVATYQTWVVKVPSHYAIADLLDPALWRSIEIDLQARAGRPQPGDFVRCIADDGSFDAVFTIEAVERGYTLRYHHGRLPEVVQHTSREQGA
jgi:hypothetical protein